MFVFLERRFTERGTEGVINSPGYPGNYGVKKNYYWTIAVPSGRKIQVAFDDFDVENTEHCGKDFLKVYDGTSDSYTLLKTICGRTLPEATLSTRNFLYLHFRSDEDVARQGFELRWKIYEGVNQLTRRYNFILPGQNFLRVMCACAFVDILPLFYLFIFWIFF